MKETVSVLPVWDDEQLHVRSGFRSDGWFCQKRNLTGKTKVSIVRVTSCDLLRSVQLRLEVSEECERLQTGGPSCSGQWTPCGRV